MLREEGSWGKVICNYFLEIILRNIYKEGLFRRDMITQTMDYIYSDNVAANLVETMVWLIRHHQKETLLTRGPIVDLGCGSGRVLNELKIRYQDTNVLGIDRQPRRSFSRVCYVEGNLQDTKLADKSVGIVLMVNLSDYLGETFQFDEFFNEIDRILMPGGVYVPLDLFRENLIRPFKFAGYHTFGQDYQEKPQ